MSKKALLMILDGWGIGDQGKDDVIFNTPTPYWDSLLANYPHSKLQASGENVGLPDGQMGNSEVGHLNIGAGRIVYQDLVKINRACADNSIMKNPEIVSAFSYAKENGKNIHFMGLTSNGGVHSSFDHLFKLCDISKEYGIENTFIHCFMDGRDTDPKSGKGFIEQLTAHCEKSAGKIASIVGRFYAMDRDKRWERVKEAYDLLVEGKGKQATDMVQAMQESYDEGVTDEFIKPINNSTVDTFPADGVQPQLYQLAACFQAKKARHCRACRAADGGARRRQCALFPVARQPRRGGKTPWCCHRPRWAGGCPFFYGDCAGRARAGGFGRNYSGKTRETGCDSP